MYENLIKSIIEQSKIESLSELKEFLEEIAIHGCASYAPYGFTYYSENVEFHAKHEDELWDMLYEMSQAWGHPSVLGFIESSWEPRNSAIGSMKQMANAIVWMCLEEIASLYLNDAINFERDDDLADLFKVAS